MGEMTREEKIKKMRALVKKYEEQGFIKKKKPQKKKWPRKKPWIKTVKEELTEPYRKLRRWQKKQAKAGARAYRLKKRFQDTSIPSSELLNPNYKRRKRRD